jgi:hypothetical protein
VVRRAATQEKRHRGDAQPRQLSEVFPKRSNAKTVGFYSHIIKNTAAAANVSEKLGYWSHADGVSWAERAVISCRQHTTPDHAKKSIFKVAHYLRFALLL